MAMRRGEGVSSVVVGLVLALVCAGLVLAACGSEEAAPDGPQTKMSDGGSYEITWTPSPDPIPRNEFFTLEVTVLDAATKQPVAADAQLLIDATMPLHGHGMDTTPTATRMDDGSWHVEGMLFHMPGEWKLITTVNDGGTVESADFVMELE